MVFSYDSASSIFLFCSEENSTILCFDDELDEVDDVQEQRTNFDENFLLGFPLPTDECVDLMIKREIDHLPKADYANKLINGDLDISVRKEAIEWMLKAHAHYNFGSLSSYLSVNYMDRFISFYELPKGRAWMTQLLSVTCLSLACKVEENNIPFPIDFQVCEPKYVFEAKTIQRMELLVLGTLKWRMQAVTPFSFIDYYLHHINDCISPTRTLLNRSAEIILSTVKGIEFLDFKPSEIAAAVAISALGEIQELELEKAMHSCKYVDKNKLLKCYELMQETIFMKIMHRKNESSSWVPCSQQSPNGVLEVDMSYKSDDTSNKSHANNQQHNSSPASKRRKVSRPSTS